MDANIVGRGLDARPGVMTGGAMEINTVPYFEGADDKGVRYTRHPAPPLSRWSAGQDGSDAGRDPVLVGSAVQTVKNWFNGGAAAAGTFDADRYGRRPEVKSIPTKYRQGPKNAPLTGIDKTLHTAAFGGKNPHIFGLQWSGPKPTGSFPEYFKQDGDAMTAVAADDVPDETHLKRPAFLPAGRGRTYTSPHDKDSVWAKPGPDGRPRHGHTDRRQQGCVRLVSVRRSAGHATIQVQRRGQGSAPGAAWNCCTSAGTPITTSCRRRRAAGSPRSTTRCWRRRRRGWKSGMCRSSCGRRRAIRAEVWRKDRREVSGFMAACLVEGGNILHEASARDRVQAGRSIFVWRAVVNALLLLLGQSAFRRTSHWWTVKRRTAKAGQPTHGASDCQLAGRSAASASNRR